MNKKILVVGAGASQTNAIRHAVNLGYELYSIDQDPSAPGFKHSKNFLVGDIKNSDFLISAAKDFQIDGITSFSTDVPVVSIAEAASALCLPSISINQAKLSVNKYLQRKMLIDFEILSPRFKTFHTISDGMNALDEIKHPAVIKPIDSSGSRGVRFSSNVLETNSSYCEKALSISSTNTGLIESFIDGPEIAVDGFVSNGKVYVLSICDKKRSEPPYLLDIELTFPSSIPEANLKEIRLMAKRIMQASKIQNSPFHIEIIVSKDGPVLVEFAARGAGFNVFDRIIPYVAGLDTVHLQIKQCLGEVIQLNKISQKAAYLYFISSEQNGVMKSIKGIENIQNIKEIAKIKLFYKEGDQVKKLSSGSDRIGYILSLSDNIDSCNKAIKLAKEYLELEIS